jgi:hypothetical protein
MGAIVPCGDTNGDGQADLCTDSGIDFGPIDGTLDVTWERAATWTTGREHLAVIDFDGDGASQLVWSRGVGIYERSDGAVWNIGQNGGIKRLVREDGTEGLVFMSEAREVLLIEEDDWGNAPQVLFATNQHAIGYQVQTGDFDGDGVQELLVFNTSHCGEVGDEQCTLHFYEQDGTLLGTRLLDHSQVFVGDHDLDGIDDLLLKEPRETPDPPLWAFSAVLNPLGITR